MITGADGKPPVLLLQEMQVGIMRADNGEKIVMVTDPISHIVIGLPMTEDQFAALVQAWGTKHVIVASSDQIPAQTNGHG